MKEIEEARKNSAVSVLRAVSRGVAKKRRLPDEAKWLRGNKDCRNKQTNKTQTDGG